MCDTRVFECVDEFGRDKCELVAVSETTVKAETARVHVATRRQEHRVEFAHAYLTYEAAATRCQRGEEFDYFGVRFLFVIGQVKVDIGTPRINV